MIFRRTTPAASILVVAAIIAWVLGFLAGPAAAGEPLHGEIDRQLAAKANSQKAPAFRPQADDYEFVRRVHLDLIGRIPSIDETRAFVSDQAADKRAKLIDRLLASPEYARHMAELFHVVLMERRGDHDEWEKFLRQSFEANKPWDQLVREIIRPNPGDEATRGAAYFHTRRLEKVGQQDTDYPGLTRDVGRLFMGVDLQCAQCHNHMFIDEYKQVDFQGLFAAFGNTFIRTDVKFPAVGEKPLAKKLEFISVFEPTRRETGPRVPFGAEVEIPAAFVASIEEKTKTKKLPKPDEPLEFSPLSELAAKIPSADNPQFAKNIVNRLWFVLMGRGIVHPLDLHHGKNAPSHPELLDLLAREFVAHQYDVKWLLREIALSNAYQRTSVLAVGQPAPPRELFLSANEKRIHSEALLWSMLTATGEWERIVLDQKKDEKLPQAAPKLSDLKTRFIKAFANPAKEPEDDYNATVKGALFLLNDEQVRRLVDTRPGNLADRLAKLSDTKQLAEELFLAVLTRQPSAEEVADVTGFLAEATKGDSSLSPEARRQAAIGQLAWALMATMEFGVNH
jgi:hypothetical protein